MSHNWHRFGTHTRVEAPYSEVMESTRTTWNDQRMDEFAERTEENFREVRNELHDEVKGLRTELKGDIKELRVEMNGRFASLEGKIDRRFDILFGALATGFVGAVVSHFLG